MSYAIQSDAEKSNRITLDEEAIEDIADSIRESFLKFFRKYLNSNDPLKDDKSITQPIELKLPNCDTLLIEVDMAAEILKRK